MSRLILNKNILIIFLLLSIFAVGTLSFVEQVEAAEWKKYDSGKFTDFYPAASDKGIISYQSYVKGNNELYANLYSYSKKTGDKKLYTKFSFSKKNGITKIVINDYSWNKKLIGQNKVPYDVKTSYKSMMKHVIECWSTNPEKTAFDKQSFTVKNNKFKVYGVSHETNSLEAFIYKNNKEYQHFSISKENNKIVYEEHNQKRELISKETFKPTKNLKSIYKNKLNKIINKIK